MIPIYSNVYNEFHTELLRDYFITESITWSDAVVGSYFSDITEEAEEEMELEPGT